MEHSDMATPQKDREGVMVNHYQGWRWWAIALRGLAAIIFGLLAVFAPGAAFISLVFIFGVYALLDGVLELSFATRSASDARGWVIGRGLISIIAGVVAIARPDMGAIALLYVIAAWAIVSGVLEIASAIRLRKMIRHEWLLALEGVLSIAFGIALIISPLAGAIVIGLWVGAFALVFGGMLIGTAFRLRSYLREHPEVTAGPGALPVPA
jgi:uncharacterized membrane protein HdeD (DUF308 family)